MGTLTGNGGAVTDPPLRAKPLISVVVPVRNVADYLDECFGSILNQGFDDLEVIAVDGDSQDASRDILKVWAQRDSRLKVSLLDEAGAGRARNAGLELASGRFVWFVDADDVVVDGALRAIADRLLQVEPDVLLIGYEHLLRDGTVRQDPEADLVRLDLPPSRLADNPALVNFTMTAWSKVIRRDFLIALQVPFPHGRHEDVPVSSAALLAAEKVGTLNRVCYRYRKNRPGALMAHATDKNLAIFESYHHVFELIGKQIADDDPKVTEGVVTAFFERAIHHYATILNAGGLGSARTACRLVPKDHRRVFFRLMHEDYLSLRPQNYNRPDGLRGIEFMLIERDAFRMFTALEPLNHLRVHFQRTLAK